MRVLNFEILNQDFSLAGIVENAQSATWAPEFRGKGTFSFVVSYSAEYRALLAKGNLVTRKDDDNVGIIRTVRIVDDIESQHIEVKGEFALGILNQRIVMDKTDISGNKIVILRTLVNNNLIDCANPSRNYPDFELDAAIAGAVDSGTPESHNFYGTNLLSACARLLKNTNYGLRVVIVRDTAMYTPAHFELQLIEGKNRAYSQSENNRILFSDSYDNLMGSEYESTHEGYKNVALVLGEGEGANRLSLVVGAASGKDRFETAVNAQSKSTENGELTAEEYAEVLKSTGMGALSLETDSFAGTVAMKNNYIYRKDFDIGDIVTLANSRTGVQVDIRVMGMTETEDAEGYSLIPILGAESEVSTTTSEVDGEVMTKLYKKDVVNALDSDAADLPLSAKMGKELKSSSPAKFYSSLQEINPTFTDYTDMITVITAMQNSSMAQYRVEADDSPVYPSLDLQVIIHKCNDNRATCFAYRKVYNAQTQFFWVGGLGGAVGNVNRWAGWKRVQLDTGEMVHLGGSASTSVEYIKFAEYTLTNEYGAAVAAFLFYDDNAINYTTYVSLIIVHFNTGSVGSNNVVRVEALGGNTTILNYLYANFTPQTVAGENKVELYFKKNGAYHSINVKRISSAGRLAVTTDSPGETFKFMTPVSYANYTPLGNFNSFTDSLRQKTLDWDDIVTTLAASESAASDKKVLAEKTAIAAFLSKAPLASPQFTGVPAVNGYPIGVYRLYAANNTNYHKFLTLDCSAAGNREICLIGKILTCYTHKNEAEIKIDVTKGGNILVNTAGWMKEGNELNHIGDFYWTINNTTKIIDFYYKSPIVDMFPTLSIIAAGSNSNAPGVMFTTVDTGSASAPSAPSGGSAGQLLSTDFKRVLTQNDISITMPSSEAAASDLKATGEKLFYKEIEKKMPLTGQPSVNGYPIGVYRLYAANNTNYHKFLSIDCSVVGYRSVCLYGKIMTTVSTGNEVDIKINVQKGADNNTFTINAQGWTKETINTSKIGTLYWTVNASTKIVDFFYKSPGTGIYPTLTLFGAETHNQAPVITFALADTGSASEPATPSGGSAGQLTTTGYKLIATTDSPAFSGTPTAPTPTTGDNSTKIATTAFVQNQIAATKASNSVYGVAKIYVSGTTLYIETV